jgi:hypothetical protein
VRLPKYGIAVNFVTTARPDNVDMCNFGPITVIFTTPVKHVTLSFAGATDTYTLEAYDASNGFLGAAYQNAVAYGGTFDVSLSSTVANIARVKLSGPAGALTAITKIYFEW